MEKVTENLSKLEKIVQDEFEKATNRPRKTLERFPTLFLLLVTAGFVLVLFGFERLFDKIPLFHDNPLIMIILGLIILAFTGRLYKKLDN